MEILPTPHTGEPGLLIAIGGAEDKTRERVILNYFLEAAGGADANLVVLATASESPETGDRYADLFLALRAENVEVLKIETRNDAVEAGAEAHDLLEYATGLFIIGERKIINQPTVDIHIKSYPALNDDDHHVRFITCFFDLRSVFIFMVLGVIQYPLQLFIRQIVEGGHSF